MSGENYYAEESEPSGSMVRRPNGSLVGWASSFTAALAFVDELNAAARSGSPERWPEGADAELVEVSTIFGDPGGWEVFDAPFFWFGAAGYLRGLKWMPARALVVARRKPKPVTRDVRAEDVRGAVRLRTTEHGIVHVRPSALLLGSDGATVQSVNFNLVDGQFFDNYPATELLSVLVEGPNG